MILLETFLSCLSSNTLHYCSMTVVPGCFVFVALVCSLQQVFRYLLNELKKRCFPSAWIVSMDWEANSSADMKAIHLLQEPLRLWVSYCSWPSVCCIYTAIMAWIWNVPHGPMGLNAWYRLGSCGIFGISGHRGQDLKLAFTPDSGTSSSLPDWLRWEQAMAVSFYSQAGLLQLPCSPWSLWAAPPETAKENKPLLSKSCYILLLPETELL